MIEAILNLLRQRMDYDGCIHALNINDLQGDSLANFDDAYDYAIELFKSE